MIVFIIFLHKNMFFLGNVYVQRHSKTLRIEPFKKCFSVPKALLQCNVSQHLQLR